MSAIAAAQPFAPAAPRAARLALLPLVAFSAAAVGAGLARAVTTTYLPLLLNEIESAPGLIGTVMLVNAIAGFAIPLVVGVWSDRLQGSRRRTGFIVGGSLLGGGGLLAVALGSSTSYAVLTAAGAIVYVGLNAVTTVHRALVPERFPQEDRPRATSAQELALLVGGLAGIAVGGALTEVSLWAPFVVAAVALPLLSLPTLALARGAAGRVERQRQSSGRTAGYYLHAAARPRVRGFLLAQILWVLGYAALPAFFLLYAEEELGLRPAAASLWLAAFGIATAAAIVAGGRVRRPALQRPLLLAGVMLMGVGFLGVSASTELLAVGPSLLAGAAGFGLISTLGFPLFSELIPKGEEGGYSALYFSVRAIASTIALPTAGWLVAATDSYRALFVLGGIATLGALVPLGASALPRSRGRVAVALLALVPLLGVLVAHTRVRELDEALFLAINGLGPGPELLWEILDPHTRNYVVLIALAVAAAAVTRPSRIPRVATLVLGSALLAWAILEAVYAVYDRARPEEVFEAGEVVLNGHSWAHLNSFPSGHMAITAALAAGAALSFRRAVPVLAAYVAAVAFTRVMFGAHFPFDTVAGTALGIASALLVAAALDRARRSPVGADEAAAPSPLAAGAVAAVIPSHNDVPTRELLGSVAAQVGVVVLVDDGSDEAVARELDEAAAAVGAELVRLPRRGGKGSAVRAGVEHVRGLGPYEAVMVVDADGQHPPEAIDAFLVAAQGAELVIGDRLANLGGMPLQRRIANRSTRRLFELATGREVRDTQNGMRLLRGRALELLPAGGYEAETEHLRRVLLAGLPVAWVPIPAIYGEERSSFRAGRDSLKVLWALVRPLEPPVPRLLRSLRPAGFRPARPSGSAFPGTPVTAPPAPRARAAVA
ncbi:MAG TPA: MFS transporter [Gaiellaceae bacterium]|nr:MFS transporter [Gaiellaceae bacterium]